jgi:hypothetical protein
MEEDRKTNKERMKEVKRYKDGGKKTQRKSGWGKQRKKQYEFSRFLLPAMSEYVTHSLT